MNLMHLRYFCKLAETQHYTQAAAELYISQPGLSGAISSLEEELGIRLFEKKGRNIHLTKYGKEFYRYVNDSLKILDTGISVAQSHGDKLGGAIDIMCITTILGDYVPMVVSEFKKDYPKVTFHIFQGQTEEILTSLEKEVYDIGFCTYNETRPDLTGFPVVEQEVIALLSHNHPLAERDSISLEELTGSNIYTYSSSQQIGRQIISLMKKHKLQPSPVADFCNERFIAGLIWQEANSSPIIGDEKYSVGLLCKVPSLIEFPDLIQVPVDDIPKDFRKIYLVYNQKRFNPHAVNLFVEYIKDYFSLEPKPADTVLKSANA
ncbi:MAG: LysR family transcriptional regulator [Clostridiales bacterium]|nr:LysR family transcriptional regulator [Clostridiales bacterium]